MADVFKDGLTQLDNADTPVLDCDLSVKDCCREEDQHSCTIAWDD